MKWNEAKGISVHYKHGQRRQCEEHGFFGQIYIGRREKEFQSYNCKDFTSYKDHHSRSYMKSTLVCS